MNRGVLDSIRTAEGEQAPPAAAAAGPVRDASDKSLPGLAAQPAAPRPFSLRDYWYIAAASRELGVRPIRRTIDGEPLVLFRGRDGAPHVLLDRCAHRNTALSTGRVIDGCIECPYHGWRYDGAGACVHIPALDEGTRRPRIAVRSFPAVERDRWIWAYLGDAAPTATAFHFPHYAERGWTSFRMKTRFAASVEACLENFLDCPHTVFVHKGWFRSRDTRALTAVVRRRADSVEVEFQDEPISRSVVSRLLFPKGRSLKHTDRFLMPNLSRVDYDFGPDRHFIITSQCTPVGPEETLVYTVITYRFGRIAPAVRLFFEPLCRHIIRQDVRILRAQTEQLRRFGGPKFAHVETDLLGLQIHSLRSGQAGDDRDRAITIRF